MSSLAQLNANRSNAAHSTGPRTGQGKLAVAQNARKHGLSGAHVILYGESPADYDALLESLRAEHNTTGITENFLAEQMAQAQWKLMRIARIEQHLLQPVKPLLEQFPPGSHPDKVLAAQFNNNCTFAGATMSNLTRYEAAARRAYMQSLRQLLALQRCKGRDPQWNTMTVNTDLEVAGPVRLAPQETQRAAAPKPVPVQKDTPNYKTNPSPASAPPSVHPADHNTPAAATIIPPGEAPETQTHVPMTA